ncbi:MAG: hypothetical protein ABIN96_01110, partial [Rubrivivax sp.]
RIERTRFQVCREAALVQHRDLRIQHDQVCAEAGLTALHREVVGRFGRDLRVLLFGLLAHDRAQARDLIGGGGLNSNNHRAVVAFDGCIDVGSFPQDVRGQESAIDDRQVSSGPIPYRPLSANDDSFASAISAGSALVSQGRASRRRP